MDSSQKRERDRKQRQRRQEKEARRKDRAEQKQLRAAAFPPVSDPSASDPADPAQGRIPEEPIENPPAPGDN